MENTLDRRQNLTLVKNENCFVSVIILTHLTRKFRLTRAHSLICDHLKSRSSFAIAKKVSVRNFGLF